MIEVTKFEDNSQQILKEFEEKVKIALEAIGVEAEGFAKENCPVDTGRLRGSITFATSTHHSSGQSPATHNDTETRATPEENTVYIGTNVEYAPTQEFMDMRHEVGRAHFLRDAATTHNALYKEISEKALKG